MNIEDQKIMDELIAKFQKLMPGKEIRPQPATATAELLDFEKQFKINTLDVVERNKDISHIPEETVRNWELTFRTFKIMKGSMGDINSIPSTEIDINDGYLKSKYTQKKEYLENPNKKANPKGFAFSITF